jgi:hypothetical protein
LRLLRLLRKRERGGDGRLAELRELNAQSPGVIY